MPICRPPSEITVTGSSKASPRKQMSQPEQQGLISSLAKHGLSWGDPAQPRSQIPVNSHHEPSPGFSLGPCSDRPTRGPSEPLLHYRVNHYHMANSTLGLQSHSNPTSARSPTAPPVLAYFQHFGQAVPSTLSISHSSPATFQGQTETYSHFLQSLPEPPTPTEGSVRWPYSPDQLPCSVCCPAFHFLHNVLFFFFYVPRPRGHPVHM